MSAGTRHFIRHYIEMVLAMVLGMAVLWVPATMALRAIGISSAELHDDAPALMLGTMAMTMTVPMVWWMRRRGHGWAPCAEMSASMVVPTLGVLALLGAGVVTDMGALMTIEHMVMLPAMLGVMLLRRDEYSCAHGHAPRAESEAEALASA
jgi:hypothetical protein